MTSPWYGDSESLLELAVALAKEDGIKLPAKEQLRLRSFLGTENYWIQNNKEQCLCKVSTNRIKAAIQRRSEVEAAHLEGDKEERRGGILCDQPEFVLRLRTKSFCIADELETIPVDEKVRALEYIFDLNKEIGYGLIGDVWSYQSREDARSCIKSGSLLSRAEIQGMNPRGFTCYIGNKFLSEFWIKEQEFFFVDAEKANEASQKFLEIPRLLGVIKTESQRDYLSLSRIHESLDNDEDLEWTASRWLNIYPSLLPSYLRR